MKTELVEVKFFTKGDIVFACTGEGVVMEDQTWNKLYCNGQGGFDHVKIKYTKMFNGSSPSNTPVRVSSYSLSLYEHRGL